MILDMDSTSFAIIPGPYLLKSLEGTDFREKPIIPFGFSSGRTFCAIGAGRSEASL